MYAYVLILRITYISLILHTHTYRLKMSKEKSRYILTKLKLLEMGEITAAIQFDDIFLPSQIFNNDNENNKSQKQHDNLSYIHQIENRYQIFHKLRVHNNTSPNTTNNTTNTNPHKPTSVAIKTMQREVIETFQKDVISIRRCENCHSPAVSYRKDGSSKLFQRPGRSRVVGGKNKSASRFNKVRYIRIYVMYITIRYYSLLLVLTCACIY